MLPLKKLKIAVRKVRFLLSFDISKWLARSASDVRRRRRLGIKGPRPGLLDFVSNADTESTSYQDCLTPGSFSPAATPSPAPPVKRTLSSTWSGLWRSESGVSDGAEDVDQSAQEFIDNFRSRLLREISLDLAYTRTSSMEIDDG